MEAAFRRLKATLAEGRDRLAELGIGWDADARYDESLEHTWSRTTEGEGEMRSVHRHGCGLRLWDGLSTGFVAQEGAVDWARALDQARFLARLGSGDSPPVIGHSSGPARQIPPPPSRPSVTPPEPDECLRELLAKASRSIPGMIHGRARLFQRQGWRGVVRGGGWSGIRGLDAVQLSLTLRLSAGDRTHVLPLFAAGTSSESAHERMRALLVEIEEDLGGAPKWKPLQPGSWPVVLSPRMSAALVHEALGHPSEADRAPLDRLDKIPLGLQLGSSELNVVDRADLEDLCGSMHIDDEGTPCREAPLVQEGRWTGLLHSRETARTVEVEPTGNARATSFRHPPQCRMRVLDVAPGPAPRDDLFGAVGNGYYLDLPSIGHLRGSALAIHASQVWYIERGQRTCPVPGAKLITSPLSGLGAITHIGADLRLVEELPWCTRGMQADLAVSHRVPSVLLAQSELAVLGDRT